MAPKNRLRKSNYSRNARQETREQNRAASRQQHNRKHNKPKHHYGCGICQADHSLVKCKRFNKLNLAEKYKTATKLHYCINCLARNHLITKCNSQARCHQCKGKHHTLLHGPARILKELHIRRSSSPSTSGNIPTPAPRRSLATSTITNIISTTMTKTFVPTVIVQVIMDKGNKLARAILNPSLTKSRIASSFVKDSCLIPFKVDREIFVKVIIAPSANLNLRYELCMQVVNELPKSPYHHTIDENIKNKVCRITLADPEFYTNTPVAMEIGGELYTKILQPNMIHIDGGSLVAQDSTLGWLIMGSLTN